MAAPTVTMVLQGTDANPTANREQFLGSINGALKTADDKTEALAGRTTTLEQTAVSQAGEIETIRELAFDAGDVYETTAAGLDGTTEGQQFKVASSDPNIAHLIYSHDAGGVATLIVTVPSVAALADKAPAANAPKVFGSRSDAVTAGQAAIQGVGAYIYTIEGEWIALRRAATNGAGTDPLFGSYPYWGVSRKIPTDGNAFVARDPLADGATVTSIVASGIYQGKASTAYVNLPADWPADLPAFELIVTELVNTAGATSGRFAFQRITSMTVEAQGTNQAIRRSYERLVDTESLSNISGQYAWIRTDAARPLAGKTIVTIGDSIVQGQSGFYWQPRVAGITGAVTVNGGCGGARMAVHDDADFDAFSAYNVAAAIQSGNWTSVIAGADAADGDTTPGVDDGATGLRGINARALRDTDWSEVTHLVLMFGTNDFTSNVPIGTDSDNTGATLKGALNLTINRILTTHPKIKILICTPLWRSRVYADNDSANLTPNGLGLYLRDYADAIIDRAEAYQLPVLDLTRRCGINMFNAAEFLNDGLHPRTSSGTEHMAGLVAAGLLEAYRA